MPRRYRQRRRKTNNDPTPLGLFLILLLLGSVFYGSIDTFDTRQIVVLALIVTVIIFSGGYFAYVMHKRRQQKLRALNMIDVDSMSGLDFERYLAELLKARGYSNVTLTEKYDYGVDIIAEKDGVRWGIQAKRYRNLVKAEAVRQVVTGLNKYNCQRSMVITNSVYSRPARVLAESNNCVLVVKDQLAGWIVQFQNNTETRTS